jgi:hypothetical protein
LPNRQKRIHDRGGFDRRGLLIFGAGGGIGPVATLNGSEHLKLCGADMQVRGVNKSSVCRAAVTVAAGLCSVILVVGPGVSEARAQSAGANNTRIANVNTVDPPTASTRRTIQPPTGPKKKPVQAARPSGPIRYYFVEFRARLAESYGHAYLVHGRVDEKGLIIRSEVAGLHPFGESVLPWLIGHIIPVPAETGASDGDLEEMYISARYRVLLSEAAYRDVAAYIKKQQASNPLWHAGLNNCVGFLKDVASYMGLKTPISSWFYPEVFVNQLRELNESPDRTAKTVFPRLQWGVQ